MPISLEKKPNKLLYNPVRNCHSLRIMNYLRACPRLRQEASRQALYHIGTGRADLLCDINKKLYYCQTRFSLCGRYAIDKLANTPKNPGKDFDTLSAPSIRLSPPVVMAAISIAMQVLWSPKLFKRAPANFSTPSIITSSPLR